MNFAVPDEDNGCPDGYVLCHGVCAPSCDDFGSNQESAATVTASAKGGKGGKKR